VSASRRPIGPVNKANAITMVRILLIPVFVVLVFSNIPYGAAWAIAAFSVAAMTDGLDGYVARSRNQVTTIGKILDPIADKMLVSAALISLVGLDQLAAWVAMVIIGREFAVSALRVVAVDQGVIIPASNLGKGKTISQIVAIIILLWPHGDLWFAPLVEWTAIAVMVAFTLLSGIQYAIRSRDVLQVPPSPPEPTG
jgi:CDP-diacylglycerol---glycerol-3-phosphate 3-phosphatidyltransferase